MSTPTTSSPEDLQSRLPDPSLFIPEVAETSGAMFKATGNSSIPRTTISLMQLRAGQIVGRAQHYST